jgi:hypothetical protein
LPPVCVARVSRERSAGVVMFSSAKKEE